MEPLNRECIRIEEHAAAKGLDRLALSEQIRNNRVSEADARIADPTSWGKSKASGMPKLTDDLQKDVVNGMPPPCDDVMDTDMDRQGMPAVLSTIDVPKGKRQGVQPCAAISERASRTVVDEDIARQVAGEVVGVKGGADRLPPGTAGSTMLDHVQDEVEAQQAADLRELW